jgi:hypothetical protein
MFQRPATILPNLLLYAALLPVYRKQMEYDEHFEFFSTLNARVKISNFTFALIMFPKVKHGQPI